MGAVYKAEDLKLKRTVALKFLPCDDPEMKRRFLQEAQAAAALNHPNIRTVFEIDEEHGFLGMEYVEGRTLKARIGERPLKLDEAFDIAAQIGAGLQAAHEKNVIHRDIKPANVMITPQGVAKIMDFGLARLGGRTRITKIGSALGTPAYMSPEQARGENSDRRTTSGRSAWSSTRCSAAACPSRASRKRPSPTPSSTSTPNRSRPFAPVSPSSSTA
jgi:serine/threonine protein kinase